MSASGRWLPALLVFAAAGCIPTSTNESKPDGEEKVASSSASCCDGEAGGCCAEDAAPVLTSATAVKSDVIELKAVKYEQLTEAVRAHRGKVVVVDIWATYCVPCMKEFPHLVDLHHKYGSAGLVCISVSVDEPDKQEKALAFLKKVKATFPNYRLDEAESVWPEKLLLKGVPAVFVFDRDGKRVAKFTNDDPDNQFDYTKDVLPLVGKLMEKK
jgi:thiol-disulfide isomerase/thioredoxin